MCIDTHLNQHLVEEYNMMGTMFCQYETPCGWCTRLDKECTEKGGCKPKRKIDAENEILSKEAKKAGWKSGVMNC